MTTAPLLVNTTAAASPRHLVGTPGSRGVRTGTAVRGPISDRTSTASQTQSGIVLVLDGRNERAACLLTQTHPAAVLVTGGALSNVATIARELGIPLVTLTVAQLRSIADGTELSVDGDRGLVTIHPQHAR